MMTGSPTKAVSYRAAQVTVGSQSLTRAVAYLNTLKKKVIHANSDSNDSWFSMNTAFDIYIHVLLLNVKFIVVICWQM